MILTRLCYCPRPSWIWELAEERRSQPSHGVGTAASGLTLDQVEALELMSQCNGGETDDSRPLPFSFFFFFPLFPWPCIFKPVASGGFLICARGLGLYAQSKRFPRIWISSDLEPCSFLDKRTIEGSDPLERPVLLGAWPRVSADPGHRCLGHKFLGTLARLKSFGCLRISYTVYTWGFSLLLEIPACVFSLSGERRFELEWCRIHAFIQSLTCSFDKYLFGLTCSRLWGESLRRPVLLAFTFVVKAADGKEVSTLIR